ncbi:hypothetical protein CSA80_01405 [Candidatus Saccharibacteria bacterium]|nr:MAG: hypothetical protein CSA80_01405 [Candidatus Saccharibacteria bacterium]
MEKTLDFLSTQWRLIVIGLGISLIAYVLLFRGITTLTGNYANLELQTQQQSHSLRTIYENPVNAPYKTLVWLGMKMGHHSIAVTRVAAASFAVIAAVLFYWIATHWYSKRIAFLSSVLFASSSGFLHIGRLGSAHILQMATLVLISCVFLFQRTKHEHAMTYAITAIIALCLYVPSMIWFALIGLIIMGKSIIRLFGKLGPMHTVAVIALGALLVAPLALGALRDASIARDIASLPATLPSWQQLGENLLHLGSSIMYKGYWPTEYWLYGAPLLNISESILFIAGLIMLVKRPILRGNYFLIGTLFVATALIALGSSATMALIIPLVYLTIAGGLFYLLDQWLTVFPKNPVAKYTGILLLLTLSAFSVSYHIRAYYTAWPNAPETKTVYTVKQPS